MNARSAFERCDRRGTPAYFQYTDTQTDRRRATTPRGDPPHANRGSISQLFCGARLASREACSRARARDERESEATERIGWGGCGKGAPGCYRSSRTQNHQQHTESAGEGVANECPGAAKSYGSRTHQQRIQSATEDVAEDVPGSRPIVPCGTLDHVGCDLVNANTRAHGSRPTSSPAASLTSFATPSRSAHAHRALAGARHRT